MLSKKTIMKKLTEFMAETSSLEEGAVSEATLTKFITNLGSLEEHIEKNEKIIFTLNHDLAQCKSKTEIALKYIACYHYQNLEKYKYHQTDGSKYVKLISIVFTNNSLLEGKAWKSRTSAQFKNQNIVVQRLASDVDKKGGDFSRGVELMNTFTSYLGKEEKSNLGDVLIMCNHPQRISDIIDVITTCDGLESKVRNVELKYNIYFDECDAAMCESNCIKFVSEIYKRALSHVIDEIQIITATPTEGLFRRLIKITPDASKILNIKKGETSRIKDYKTILDQKLLPFEGPPNPIDYVLWLNEEKPYIFKEGKIYFIPGHHYCIEHDKMADLPLFKNKGFWRLVLNGKEKGFRSPLGEKIDIVPLLKEGGELRDILRNWRKKHPKAGLVITGKTVLERGITFLTDGFCFDYLILSSYFAKDISNLVQTLGRGQGKDKYVGNFTLITPQELYNKVKKYLEDTEEILQKKPEYYDLAMIAKIGTVDKYANILSHFEKSIDELNKWVKANLSTKKGKPQSLKISKWKSMKEDTDGFIKHKFGESGLKVWSLDEAKQQRGGIKPHNKRVFPCYLDLKDNTTLRWLVLYRNDD